MEWTESGRTAAGVAFELTAGDTGSPSGSPRVPRRIRRRLSESRGGPSSVEEIGARLRDADLRRQQFHAWLSSKARSKPRSPSWFSQNEDPGQRLEAKLHAAEQKRLGILSKAQMRLARMDELRQAARTTVESRLEKEREKLGTRVEYRVQQAEKNRLHLLKATAQRRVAAHERTARLLLQRINREAKYKERVRMSISQKRASAEKKRLGMLEAEKTKARTRFMQACRIAKLVSHQRESERRKMKEQLDNRLQKARWQRAEYLRQRGGLHSSSRINHKKMHKEGDILCRKLARCWRKFVSSKRTTLALVMEYEALGINEKSFHSMPFEQLAGQIQSSRTLYIVKSLLDRLECRLVLSQLVGMLQSENIDHLLKHVISPIKRGSSVKLSQARGQMRRDEKEIKCSELQKLPRYPVRVVLCAYMILGQPDAVFSGRGNCEIELTESAINFIHEFEWLIKIVLDGPREIMRNEQEQSNISPSKRTFRSQLAAFDVAWHSYLYRFVVWKVKDAKLLEKDLVRAACQLELSMMQKCKLTSSCGQIPDLTHDMMAIQKQVIEDQHLLREKVKHLSGDAGIERMDSALSDTRSKFFEAKESGNSLLSPVAHISSPLLPTSSLNPSNSPERSNSIVRSLFADLNEDQAISKENVQGSQSIGLLSLENEVLVNEILHDPHGSFTESSSTDDDNKNSIKAKVKRTMEKAFWDGIIESLTKENPDYGRVIGLVKEVRDELHEMAPSVLKQEIDESIGIDNLTQLLESGSVDMDYLGKILEYSLATLLKLSAPAKEAEMKKAHQNLLQELVEVAKCNGKCGSFVAALVKGLRYVLEEIKVLQKEISKARILLMVPIVTGPAGVEYLRRAFGDRFGPSCYAVSKLPLTKQWLSSLRCSIIEWRDHIELMSTLNMPMAIALRSGGSTLPNPPSSSQASFSSYTGVDECKGEQLDVILRIGVLKLVHSVEGLNEETLPETLKFNFSRLRNIQGNLQKIIVISTSMLVLRQFLISEKIATKTADIECKVSGCVRSLSGLLEHVPDVGIMGIIDTIISSCEEKILVEKKELIARVLVKSLQAGNDVFKKVSKSLYMAIRSVVLGGTGIRGRELADIELRRCGASLLLEQVADAGKKLALVAKISCQVHRLWYESLLQNW